ncbi:MAG: hypothetical protein HY675_05260 [Chloroflexi bacterium]|nr:hypothetical protein [Chloroflexota bacterium]
MSDGVTADFSNPAPAYSYAALDIAGYLKRFAGSRVTTVNRILPRTTFQEMRMQHPTWQHVVNAVAALPLASRVTGSGGTSLETFVLLLDMFETLQQGRGLAEHQATLLAQLRHKIEVFGRLFEFYDATLHRRGSDLATAGTYAMLSIVSNMTYLSEGDPRAFNAATKANDIILHSGWQYEPIDTELVCFSVLLEDNVVQRILQPYVTYV